MPVNEFWEKGGAAYQSRVFEGMMEGFLEKLGVFSFDLQKCR